MAKRRGHKPETPADISGPAAQPDVEKLTAAEPEQPAPAAPDLPQSALQAVPPRFTEKMLGERPKELPVVDAPSLDPSEAMTASIMEPELNFGAQSFGRNSEPPQPPGAAEGVDSATPPTSRFALLAASLAVAAAIGAAVGSLSTSGLVHWRQGGAIAQSGTSHQGQFQGQLQGQLAEFSALKSELEAATRNASTQLAKIADRLDRVERAEQEPSSKLTHIADAVDRLEKRVAGSPEITGSIGAAPASASASAEPKPAVLPDWIVQEVQGGRALIQNRSGGLFDISAGSVLPGIGRVEAIKRQDGQWVVVTARGLITPTGR
jgi:hypothetical protein